ncbi:hypothetical protein [Streptosporangium sp. NPDC051022]|uniref:hypothetical protein n=1 Tax=Streptosporangium sp. NPDC051022 TaxID=3155752 RepID=UPI00342D94FD
MRRWIAAMAVVLTVPAVIAGLDTTANAQATPAGPVDALKRLLVENRGVRMSKVLTGTQEILGERKHFWADGVAEFGKGKIAAIDMTYRSDFFKGMPTVRKITFEGREYARDRGLPNGKHWLVSEDEEIRPLLDAHWTKIADPVMLKAVLATTETKRPAGVYDGTRTTLYQGAITLGELYRASPGFSFDLEEKPTAKEAKAGISWRLWLGEDQLVRRARGSWTEPFSRSHDATFSYVVDVRLTGWGAKTDITPPPADDLMPIGDLANASEETPLPLNPAAG